MCTTIKPTQARKRKRLNYFALVILSPAAYLGGVGLEKINAGCNTGGPYLEGTCGIPFTLLLDGTFDCSDGSPPDVVWYSPDSADIFIQDVFVQDPEITVYDYGVFSLEATVSCGVEAPVQCSTTVQVNEACLPDTRAPFYSTDDGAPSPAPTSTMENRDGGIIGEPHILRWNQESFDFHGEWYVVIYPLCREGMIPDVSRRSLTLVYVLAVT